jgi:hypothetical protein
MLEHTYFCLMLCLSVHPFNLWFFLMSEFNWEEKNKGNREKPTWQPLFPLPTPNVRPTSPSARVA